MENLVEVPTIPLENISWPAVKEAFSRYRVLLLRGSTQSNQRVLAVLEELYADFPDVVEANWVVENEPGSRLRPTPSTVFKPRECPVELGDRWYASFTVQGSNEVLQQVLTLLPDEAFPFGTAPEVVHKVCAWVFLGRNSSGTKLMGRPEHTDAVNAAPSEEGVFGGTWHAQLEGQKEWRLRPYADEQVWKLAGVEEVPQIDASLSSHSEDNLARLSVVVRTGDVLVVDTSLWLHQTALPPHLGGLSVSIARDFRVGADFDEGAEDCKVTNVDAAWIRDGVNAGDIVLEETPLFWVQSTENIPECLSCCRCGAVIGGPRLLLQLATGARDRASAIDHVLTQLNTPVSCTPTSRDRLLCSIECRASWLESGSYRLFDRYASMPRNMQANQVQGVQDSALSRFRMLALRSGQYEAVWLSACVCAEAIRAALLSGPHEDADNTIPSDLVLSYINDVIRLPSSEAFDTWANELTDKNEEVLVETEERGYRIHCSLHETETGTYGMELLEGKMPSGSMMTVVRDVLPGSEAWAYGIQAKDIVVRLAGNRVENLKEDLATVHMESKLMADRCVGPGFGPCGWLNVEFEFYRRTSPGMEVPRRRVSAKARFLSLLREMWECMCAGFAEAMTYATVILGDPEERQTARAELLVSCHTVVPLSIWQRLVMAVHCGMCEIGPGKDFVAPTSLQVAARRVKEGSATDEDIAFLKGAYPNRIGVKKPDADEIADEVLDLSPDVVGAAIYPDLCRVPVSTAPESGNCSIRFPGSSLGLTAYLVAVKDLPAGTLLTLDPNDDDEYTGETDSSDRKVSKSEIHEDEEGDERDEDDVDDEDEEDDEDDDDDDDDDEDDDDDDGADDEDNEDDEVEEPDGNDEDNKDGDETRSQDEDEDERERDDIEETEDKAAEAAEDDSTVSKRSVEEADATENREKRMKL